MRARLEHTLDASHHFVVLEQLATACRGAAFFDGLNEPGVVFGDVPEPGFLFR
jgi:hypothetical protein